MIDHALEQAPPRTVHGMSDDVLITLFQGGEKQVFRTLVERYQERVRNLVYSVLNDSSMIDDLAQEVFIKVYEGLPQFRFDASFYTWLYRITINRCRDEIRKKRVRKWLSLHHLLDNHDKELTRLTSTHMKDTETQDLIDRALHRLPDKFRIAIVLKDMQGLSYEEISEVTQSEIGTVKSRLFRGRAMLRNYLQPLMEA